MSPSHQRVAVITGVSSGIGLACAAHLAQQGVRIYGLSRRAPETAIPNLTFIQTDVTDNASVREAVRIVLRNEGRIDILINNAGFGIAGSIEDTSAEEAAGQLDVNLLGALRLTSAVLPTMRRQRSGYILNMGSIGGLIAIPFQGIYSASKFALEGLTESLRLEVRSLGIRVVLIEPGDHRTAFTQARSFTAASAMNPAYRANFDRAVNRMAADEQGGPAPDRIARLVLRVINTRNPRLRYTAGPTLQRAAIWLKRLFPYALIETILKVYYGLK